MQQEEKNIYQNSVQQEYEMALKIRKYMEECNGKDSWKPYVGSQLEADLIRFVLKEKKQEQEEKKPNNVVIKTSYGDIKLTLSDFIDNNEIVVIKKAGD